jgi:bifunctional non-homologous end joining protein LigD
MEERSVSLYFTEGSSNKVYQAHLRQKDPGWVVDFAYGPRGKALKTGAKTSEPVSYEQALKVYDKLVGSKKKDGYTEDVSGAVYTSSEYAGRSSGLALQRSIHIDDNDLEAMLADPRWGAQEKANGERRGLIYKDGQLRGTNLDGLFVDIPKHWEDQVRATYDEGYSFEIDGEHVGDRFKAFDLLAWNGEDQRAKSFERRVWILNEVVFTLRGNAADFIRLLECHTTEQAKRTLLDYVKASRREGVVFKQLDAPYHPGRSLASMKYKLVDSSTCVVLAKNTQRSVKIGMHDGIDGPMVPMGNVTIPPNAQIPEVGALIEVEYLYYNPGGALEQPVFLKERTDVTREAAVVSQIVRIKPALEEEAVGYERPRGG